MPTYVILRVDDDGVRFVDDDELVDSILQRRRGTAERERGEGGAGRGGDGVLHGDHEIHGRHRDRSGQRAGDDGAGAPALRRPANGPGSEAEFLRAIVEKKKGSGAGDGASQTSPDRCGSTEEAASDYYAGRREFLKSYRFVRKESLPEKARRYAGAVREKVGKLSGRPKDGDFFDREVGRHRLPLEEEKAKGEKRRAKPAPGVRLLAIAGSFLARIRRRRTET